MKLIATKTRYAIKLKKALELYNNFTVFIYLINISYIISLSIYSTLNIRFSYKTLLSKFFYGIYNIERILYLYKFKYIYYNLCLALIKEYNNSLKEYLNEAKGYFINFNINNININNI